MVNKLSGNTVKQWAVEAGFSRCGIARARTLSQRRTDFEEALAKGYHADMHFLEKDIATRFNPCHLLPDCQSVIVALLDYRIPACPASTYKTARFTWIDDYHVVVKEKLEIVVQKMQSAVPNIHCRITVDSSRISEKSWAEAAGIGCFGKNGLIHNDDGSFFVIGTILTDYGFPKYDTPTESDCGECRICIDKCPAHAIRTPYRVDARLCYAYHTIENKNPEKQILRESPLLFGCDICQEVCPKNKKIIYNEAMITKSSLLLHLQNEGYENLDAEHFKLYFGKSAIARRTFEKFNQVIKAKQADCQEKQTAI